MFHIILYAYCTKLLNDKIKSRLNQFHHHVRNKRERLLYLVMVSPNFNNRQMSICRVIYKLVQKFRYCDSYPMVFQGPMFSFIRRPVLNDRLAENILSAPCVAQKTITSEFIILAAVRCYIYIYIICIQ